MSSPPIGRHIRLSLARRMIADFLWAASDDGRVSVTRQVALRDVREGKVLWENPNLVFRQEYEAQSGQVQVDPSIFFGQDQNALDRMTTEFARTIVNAILEAF